MKFENTHTYTHKKKTNGIQQAATTGSLEAIVRVFVFRFKSEK